MSTAVLSESQIESYWVDGYAVVNDGVFTGAVSTAVEQEHAGAAVPI